MLVFFISESHCVYKFIQRALIALIV